MVVQVSVKRTVSSFEASESLKNLILMCFMIACVYMWVFSVSVSVCVWRGVCADVYPYSILYVRACVCAYVRTSVHGCVSVRAHAFIHYNFSNSSCSLGLWIVTQTWRWQIRLQCVWITPLILSQCAPLLRMHRDSGRVTHQVTPTPPSSRNSEDCGCRREQGTSPRSPWGWQCWQRYDSKKKLRHAPGLGLEDDAELESCFFFVW